MNDEHRPYKCVECGHLCKTQHGLKTHMGMKHKNNSRKTKNRKKQLLKATRKYNKSGKGKLRSQKYGRSAKGKLKHHRYEKSIKGKLRKNNYKTSVKGRKTRQRNAKRKQEIKKAKKKKENELRRLLHRKKMETQKKKEWREWDKYFMEKCRCLDANWLKQQKQKWKNEFGTDDYYDQTNECLKKIENWFMDLKRTNLVEKVQSLIKQKTWTTRIEASQNNTKSLQMKSFQEVNLIRQQGDEKHEVETEIFGVIGKIKAILHDEMFTDWEPPHYITKIIIEDHNQRTLEIIGEEISDMIFGLKAAELQKLQRDNEELFCKLLEKICDSNQFITFCLKPSFNHWADPPKTNFIGMFLSHASNATLESQRHEGNKNRNLRVVGEAASTDNRSMDVDNDTDDEVQKETVEK